MGKRRHGTHRPQFDEIFFDADSDEWNIRAHMTRKEKHLRSTYSVSKGELIRQIDRIWAENNLDDTCRKILSVIGGQIRSVANVWERRARASGIRLYSDDFESDFFLTLEPVICSYSWADDFWLYETIMKKIDSTARDRIRWAKRSRRTRDLTSLSLDKLREDEGFDYPDPTTSRMEDEVTDRVLVSEILRDRRLTEDERRVLNYLHGNPDASFREIAAAVGLSHKEIARRLFLRAQRKLTGDKSLLVSGYGAFRQNH